MYSLNADSKNQEVSWHKLEGSALTEVGLIQMCATNTVQNAT